MLDERAVIILIDLLLQSIQKPDLFCHNPNTFHTRFYTSKYTRSFVPNISQPLIYTFRLQHHHQISQCFTTLLSLLLWPLVPLLLLKVSSMSPTSSSRPPLTALLEVRYTCISDSLLYFTKIHISYHHTRFGYHRPDCTYCSHSVMD